MNKDILAWSEKDSHTLAYVGVKFIIGLLFFIMSVVQFPSNFQQIQLILKNLIVPVKILVEWAVKTADISTHFRKFIILAWKYGYFQCSAVRTSKLLYSEAHFLHSNEAIDKNINTKNELINIIQSLNRMNENVKNNNEEMVSNEKERKLQAIQWLIKNNYKAEKQYDLVQSPLHSGARLYFIRNPKAIDEYKKYLERKKTRTKKQNVKSKLQELRRNLMYRIDVGENKEESNEHSDIDKNSNNNGLHTVDISLQDKDEHQNRYRDTTEDKILNNNDRGEDSNEEPLNERKPLVDSTEIHDKAVHATGRSSVDLRGEKVDWDVKNDRGDEKNLNWDLGDDKYDKIDNIKPKEKSAIKKYDNFDKVNDKFENYRENSKSSKKTYGFVKVAKFTTKNVFQRKIVNDKPKYKPKISYKKPKKYVRHDDSLYGTSIPYIGKKGIYEDD